MTTPSSTNPDPDPNEPVRAGTPAPGPSPAGEVPPAQPVPGAPLEPSGRTWIWIVLAVVAVLVIGVVVWFATRPADDAPADAASSATSTAPDDGSSFAVSRTVVVLGAGEDGPVEPQA
ncbi:hypothetical protein [Cellulosimicrobium marinum]|uniref:hypothetical protein n=1 Tax=Cellulosimicrobium marinum TaxID=1638992 RepID=UPI001E5A5E1A|nr:hypothetical protein [Cellulosimicrobium marinum]MCB7135913.1 hypothetical protein [Cellulosimicrobium marinum]